MAARIRVLNHVSRMGVWAGVDVGGRRKGFDLAVVSQTELVGVRRIRKPEPAARWLHEMRAAVVAVDSPCRPAPSGERSRECERHLAREVCGIRWTPDHDRLTKGDPYFEWIVHGLELYALLAEEPSWNVIEVFPTASWTRWAGPRGAASRAEWSRAALVDLGVGGLPARTNQDARDAIAAAVTARDHALGRSDNAFDPIIVPARAGPP